MLEPHALASALLPLHGRSAHMPSSPLAVPDGSADSTSVSRTPSGSSISSVASSSTGGEGSHSLFSSPTQTASTQLTTPANSDRGARPQEIVEAVTILASSASSSRARPTSSGGKSATSSSASTRSSTSTVRKRSRDEARKLTYTDEDWAQDVRWLAPPKMPAASGSSASARRHSARIIPPDFQLPPPLDLGASGAYSAPTARAPGASRNKGDRRSRRSRHSRGRMSALWEEDESEEFSTGLSSSDVSRASTPNMMDTPPHSLPPSPLVKATTLPSDLQEESPPSESTHESTPDARLQKYARGQRRSLETNGSYFRPGGSSSANLPTHSLPTPFPSSSSPPKGGYTGLTLPHAGYSNAKGKTTAEGHVDLVRAGVAQSSMCTIEVIRGAASTISHATAPPPLTKSRRTFSFSLGRAFSLSGLKARRRESATPAHLRGGLPLPVAFTAHVAPPTFVPESHVLVQVHAVGLDALDSFIVHEKAGGGTAGGSKGIGGGKAGFIPGRSFVGKVVECGWAVSAEVCKRGEWVVGLLDVRKCGALAEFILVERHRIHRAPQPRARNISLFAPRRRTHIRASSLPITATANGTALPYASSPLAPAPLSLEELALLPLCAVPAHRALRTFADVLTPPAHRTQRERDRENSKPDVRALVLQGHDGPGALAVQMLRRRGARVVVQIPESAVYDPYEEDRKASADAVRPSPSKHKGKGKAGAPPVSVPPPSRREQVEARLRAWGAEEVCVGEPLDVLRRLAEDGQSFDAVLDTVGGVAVWEASQRLLTMDWTATAARSSTSLASASDLPLSRSASVSHSSTHGDERRPSKVKSTPVSHAQFTTLVGDTPHRAVPTAQDNLRSGLRSLRRSMSTSAPAAPSPGQGTVAALGTVKGKKGRAKRVVGYAWVSVAADVDFEGEDVRDALGAVVRMAEGGWLRPWVIPPTTAGDAQAQAQTQGQEEDKIVPFERAPEVFRRGVVGALGVLADGGTCAVRIVE
ncbi:hypothetical protein C2E23DRAFT_727655 [Lenzites betulinus]|nr:hypothetical protein C2E23DRAFT_727655 [Lenzites betulinus]